MNDSNSEGRPGSRVLVVDDDAQMRRLLSVVLSGEGFACDVAGDLAEARARLADFDPDLVLLDVRCPGSPGSPWPASSERVPTARR